MVNIYELEAHLDSVLSSSIYDDKSYNGLQVEGGRKNVKKLATGVTASLALIEKAANEGVDTILVHHGLFWKGQPPVLRGGLGARVRSLMDNDLSLLAYHLPIDAHPKLGNNGIIAKGLGLKDVTPWGDYNGSAIGVRGQLSSCPIETLIQKVEKLVGRDVLHFKGGPKNIKTVSIVSGGASSLALSAARSSIDVFITGEPSEPCMHTAAEEKIHILAAGHHHTETFGVQAVGDHIGKEFGFDVQHINIPNPV